MLLYRQKSGCLPFGRGELPFAPLKQVFPRPPPQTLLSALVLRVQPREREAQRGRLGNVRLGQRQPCHACTIPVAPTLQDGRSLSRTRLELPSGSTGGNPVTGHLLDRSSWPRGRTLDAKSFMAWEGEGQQFHNTLSNGHSWAEEGSDPRGISVLDPGGNAKKGSQVSTKARRSCMGHLLRLLEFSGLGRKPAFMKGLPREKCLSPPNPVSWVGS